MIGGAHHEIDAFKLHFSRHSVHTVNVSVIAGFDIVFVQNIQDLAANKIAPYGREVEEEKNWFIGFAA